MYFTQQRYTGALIGTSYSVCHITVVIPNNVEDCNFTYGVFKIDESLLEYERTFMDLAKTRSSLDLIIDNVFVKKLPRFCRGTWFVTVDLKRIVGIEKLTLTLTTVKRTWILGHHRVM